MYSKIYLSSSFYAIFLNILWCLCNFFIVCDIMKIFMNPKRSLGVGRNDEIQKFTHSCWKWDHIHITPHHELCRTPYQQKYSRFFYLLNDLINCYVWWHFMEWVRKEIFFISTFKAASKMKWKWSNMRFTGCVYEPYIHKLFFLSMPWGVEMFIRIVGKDFLWLFFQHW